MAKKSSSSTVSVQSVDTNTIDVNLAKQVAVQSEPKTVSQEVSPVETPTVKPKEDSIVKKDEDSSVPAFDKEDTLSYKLKKACGVRYDLDKMVSECNGDSTKLKLAYDKVIWHLGRIHSCGDSTHTGHVGRYDSEGNQSSIVKEIKTLFSQK